MKEYLSAVVGNDELCRRLGKDIQANTLPHALIFEGPHGTGKHTIAKMCAAAMVCESKKKSKPLPCLNCLACRKALENKSPDIIYVNSGDRASIGVEAIRFLKEDVHIVPNDSDKKVYIIEDAEKMTVQAQNALLLTLEEPPRFVHFFLLCQSTEPLLETIKSRAPTLRTEPIPKKDIEDYLCENDRRAAQMKISDPALFKELLAASGNGIGKALEYLDPKVFAPVRQARTLTEDFLTASIKAKSSQEILAYLSKFSNKRDVLLEQLSMLSDAIRDLLLLKKSDAPSLLFFADAESAIELSDRASISFLYGLNNAVSTARDEISRNANVKLCLTKMASNAELL